jgi:hypothetical protein
MKMKNLRRRIVAETEYGLYVWVTADGKIIADDEGRQLSIPAMRGDVKAINVLRNYAYGYLNDVGLEKNGEAVFMPGHRQITDDEYEEQLSRQKFGLVPDPYDVAASTEELKYKKRFGDK